MQTMEAEKTPKTGKTANTVQKVALVKGEFTPSEARDIVSSLIDVKINFHKLQRLQRFEGQHNCDTGDLNSRIDELQEEELNFKEYIQQVRHLGKNLKITGTLKIELA